jgi:copper(I)-binding protein
MRRVTSFLGIAGAVLLAALGASGCSAAAGGAGSSISVSSAYVPQPTTPGTTVAYLDIRNNGRADRLIAAHTSVGGTVQMRAAETASVTGSTVLTMHTVSDIPIPSDTMVRLNPDNGYLQITGAGPMHDGKAIMLQLTFANAGTITVIAVVTNPQNGGSSYFLN